MKLNLAASPNPQGTLRVWATELRKRVFSSPLEFSWTEYSPLPASISGGGYSIVSANNIESSYFRHGDITFVDICVEFDITSGGGNCSIQLKLPTKCSNRVDHNDRYILGVIREGVSTYEPVVGLMDMPATGNGILTVSKANSAAISSGLATVSFSSCYRAR